MRRSSSSSSSSGGGGVGGGGRHRFSINWAVDEGRTTAVLFTRNMHKVRKRVSTFQAMFFDILTNSVLFEGSQASPFFKMKMSMEHWLNKPHRAKTIYSGRSLSQRHSVHRKSHIY
jgi:hypothetical protein